MFRKSHFERKAAKGKFPKLSIFGRDPISPVEGMGLAKSRVKTGGPHLGQ